MKKYVALFDWDYTIQRGNAMDTWVELLMEKNIIDKKCTEEVKPIFDSYIAGLISSDQRADQGLTVLGKYIEGVNASELDLIYDEFRSRNDRFINPIISKKVFPFLKENNIEIIIVSGSSDEALGLYQVEFDIDRIYAMKYDIRDGKFLSSFRVNTGISLGKQKIVNGICEEDREILFAFGDSISDVPLLKNARYSFVNNSKRFLEKDNIFYLDFNVEEAGNVIIDKITECLDNIKEGR